MRRFFRKIKLSKKKIVTLSLVVLVFVMSLGYAALSQYMDIDGIAMIDRSWIVKVTNVESSTTGDGANLSNNFVSSTVTMNAELPTADSTVTYTITLENQGNLKALLNSIDRIEDENTTITYSIEGVTEESTKLYPGEKNTVIVTMKYADGVTNISNTKKSLMLTFNYVEIESSGSNGGNGSSGSGGSYATLRTGQKVELLDGSNWYVTKYSGPNEEYVTLLTEFSTGVIAPYDSTCSTDYQAAQQYGFTMRDFIENDFLFSVVDSLNHFDSDVTGLSGRLLTYQEYEKILESGNGEALTSGDTWTMTVATPGSTVYYLEDGEMVEREACNDADVRPVIIIKKSNVIITEEPDLYNGALTPVVYDGDNWHITTSTDATWYNYADQEWANAVILKQDSTKNVGDSITVEGSSADILAMYVWIPRYEYNIEYLNGGAYAYTQNEPINIKFIQKNQTKASEGYTIHPAFLFGDTDLSGLWVSKFEISHNSSSTTAITCTDGNCAQGDDIRILPNAQSFRKNNVSKFFYAIKSMDRSGNIYGLDNSKTDSHMIKNSEWGAVAYLTQSKYGKRGNSTFSDADKEVFLNNSSSLYTGRSSGATGANSTSIAYGNYTYDGYLLSGNSKTSTRDINKVSSTTGNITGVYDMAGGTFEYVMGVYANSNGDLWTGRDTSTSNSGFTGKAGTDGSQYNGVPFPDKKYFDSYRAYNDESALYYNYCHDCYGHALNETHGFYGDYTNYVSSTLPWYTRGGRYDSGSYSGIFALAWSTGGESYVAGTHAVLTAADFGNSYKKYVTGEVVYYDVSTGSKCSNYNEENSKTGYNGIDNKTGNQNSCLKFYAFNDEGRDTINLVLDHNTTATSLWNTNGDNTTGPTEVLDLLNESTREWKGTIEPERYTTGVSGRRYSIEYDGFKARLITATEISKATQNMKWGWIENAPGSSVFYFDKIQSTCTPGVDCRYGWLYDRTSTECTEAGCYNNSDIETNGYWTASSAAYNSDVELHQEYCGGYVTYGVGDSGRLSQTCPNYAGHYGVRPVIEVPKENLS